LENSKGASETEVLTWHGLADLDSIPAPRHHQLSLTRLSTSNKQ